MLDTFTGVASGLYHLPVTARGQLHYLFGALGGLFLVSASLVRLMIPLRACAVGANLMFLGAALTAGNPVLMVLYGVLIPLNSYRLLEIIRLTRKVAAAAAREDLSGLWLKRYMRSHRLRAGTMPFRQGDAADALYLLVEGQMELAEIGKPLPVGQMFGEISFFSPERRRTFSVRCVSDCTVLSIKEDAFRQLYFQDPKFAFQVVNLVTHRLGADIERLEAQVEQLRQDRRQVVAQGPD
jgi:CRP/FNR family cyclic AMP-dependent transcriptional regulator